MTQATRIITKFGGARALSLALKQLPDPEDHRHWSVIYRWTWPRHRSGRGGLIPTRTWPAILRAARLHGIYLTEEDMSPREQEVA